MGVSYCQRNESLTPSGSRIWRQEPAISQPCFQQRGPLVKRVDTQPETAAMRAMREDMDLRRSPSLEHCVVEAERLLHRYHRIVRGVIDKCRRRILGDV